MDVTQQQYISAIAREGSLTAAARSLGVSQPALSNWLKNLEEQLGIQLVIRSKRHLVLTPAGKIYLEAAELRDLLDHLHGMAYHATYFLALTGLRIGEMTALEVSDVDQNHIHITKSYSHISRDITEPKN